MVGVEKRIGIVYMRNQHHAVSPVKHIPYRMTVPVVYQPTVVTKFREEVPVVTEHSEICAYPQIALVVLCYEMDIIARQSVIDIKAVIISLNIRSMKDCQY